MSIEWSLVFFTLFVGLAAGVFTVIAISEWEGGAVKQIRLPGAVLTLVALVIGGVSGVLHLGHPERIFGALEKPGSGIGLEALLIGVFGLIVIFYLLALRRGASEFVCKLLATIGALTAMCSASGIGHTYVLPSRPAWDTGVLPILYVVSAIVIGHFCIATLLSGRKEQLYATEFRLILNSLVLLALQIGCIIYYVWHLSKTPYSDASRSASRVLMGDLAPLFWVGVVLLGFLVPFIITWRTGKSESFANARYGLMCVLLGGIAFRAMMFLLGSPVRNFF